jgi:hypothetical protein
MTEPANPLIVRAEPGAEPLNWEGAGVVSSWADTGKALGEQDPDAVRIAFNAAGAGLDTLGAIADPFDAFLSSAIGWLIEHVQFLHEPLDALAGDPQQVVAQAQTWSNVAGELRGVAGAYRTVPLPGWDGAARDAQRAAVGDYATALDGVAVQSERLAGLVLATGAAVGTVRALIRDLIADFLAWVTRLVLAALAVAPVTMGGSTAAAIGTVGWQAYALARDIAERMSRLLDSLAAAGGTAERLGTGMRHVADEAAAMAPYLQQTAQSAGAPLDRARVGDGVEAGKQFTNTRLTDPCHGQDR